MLILLNFLMGCGYQPLLDEKQRRYSIESFIVNDEGDVRLGQILVNSIGASKSDFNKLSLNIKAKKDRSVSGKSSAGKVLEYTIDLTFDLVAVDTLTQNVVLKKVYKNSNSYKKSNVYLDTLNNEKKITKNLTVNIAEQVVSDLTLLYGIK